MKKTIIFLLGIITSNIAIAQYEQYGAGIIGDTVKIWNTNITSSCGAKYNAKNYNNTANNHSILIITTKEVI